jgi:hypothetical protein
MQKFICLFILLPIVAGGACTSLSTQVWPEIAKIFPISEENHLFGPDLYMPQPQDRRLQDLPDVPVAVAKKLNSASDQIYKAAFRLPIGFEGWQALIFLIGPGEASSSLRYNVVPFDSAKGRIGSEMELTESYGDGDYHVLESWMIDIDGDGVTELMQRFLTYSVPDSTADEPWPGIAPHWETRVYEFENGIFSESNHKYSFDTLKFPLKAEVLMKEAFLAVQRSDMLPPHLR